MNQLKKNSNRNKNTGTLSRLAVVLVAIVSIPLVHCQLSDYIGYGLTNKEVSTEEECTMYTDCYNCTLSNCDWDMKEDSCSGDDFQMRSRITQ